MIPDLSPPSNVEAEAGVIASCMTEAGAEALPDVVAILPTPEPFFREDHRELWEIILELYQDGVKVDYVSIGDILDKRGRDVLAVIEGPIEQYATSGGSFDAVFMAGVVREAWSVRNTIEALTESTRDAYRREGTAAEIISRTMDRLRGIEASDKNGTITASEVLPSVVNRIARRQAGETFGVHTGFAEFDRMTDGIQPGEFAILAARPSMGKTALALNIADHVAITRRQPVLFVSLEMSNDLLVERLLVGRSKVDSKALRTGNVDANDWARIHNANDEIAVAPIHLVRRHGKSIHEITAEIRRSKTRLGIALTIIDYIQLINGGNNRESETQAISRISQSLKNVANDLEMPILALSQLNRQSENREDRRPRMAELRGSGSLEQDADLIALLFRPEYYDPNESPGTAELDLAKNRNGPTGMFKLTFVKSLMQFSNFSDAEPPVTHGYANRPF